MSDCCLKCVPGLARCDTTKQCVDGSDEHTCPIQTIQHRDSRNLPIMVEFQEAGAVNITYMQADRGSVDTTCPETHFWCPAKDYCLPVFVRCNGVFDCPGHEDEDGCGMYTCPGFYRCRASKVCAHVIYICDGWPLCPQHDDELLCGHQCPPQCTCHGLAFFCSQVFAAHQFPELRYLDVRGSGMNVHQLRDNHMLIHLSLARCRVRAVSNFTFDNLQSLDLTDNLLTKASGHHFRHMPRLSVLFLAGNPLISVFKTFTRLEIQTLTMLDLSRVMMPVVDHSLFMTFPELATLNLSHSGVEVLLWSSTQMSVTSLRQLDLRGCLVADFPRDGLSGFLRLRRLYTDNFKLCCPSLLPPDFDLHHCHTTLVDVSSCDNLLGFVTHRTIVAVLATLAFLGNIVSLSVRVYVGNAWQLSNGGVVLTHLSVADLGTGLYLATLGLADHLLEGHYVLRDDTWRRGAICQMAGVLALSCRHAATFFITILTLHRCSRSFPALTAHLTSFKIKAFCVMVWVSSLVVASVPLTAQWRFYGQQALCVPLPQIGNDSVESSYAHGVMVLLPLVMFIQCSICEVFGFVFDRATNASIRSRDTWPNDSQFVVLGSLASGFLYTIASLVPTDSHTGRHAATHTALVYFGFMVSCATSPYLHLYGVRVERSKRIKEERLLRIVSRAGTR